MGQRIEDLMFDAEVQENCPECGHSWKEDGPAHFTECRYFCLDDDRDEEPFKFLQGKIESTALSLAPLRS
jgi:hypothetical protein